MPLFETAVLDEEELKELVKKHWNVTLGANLKVSQNKTFQGEMDLNGVSKTVIIRATPNIGGKRALDIELELRVLHFLSEKELPVCEAYPALESNVLSVSMGDWSISVFHYAKGEPVVFTDWKWMTEEEIVKGVGRFIGRLHRLLDEFEDKYPELASAARDWRELHDGVLKDVKVHEKDEATKLNSPLGNTKPRSFGIIHGDINPSNYFWYPEISMPSMFDWDQLQRSWRLYDLSSCIWTVVMLEGAGSPVDMSPVPQANVKVYTEWLLKGYETETGTIVDREALNRMVDIRRHLYRTFCAKALPELPPGSFMYNFCKFIDDWLSGKNETKN
jgi:Ser/Thr protein kinase RdoA (MazF antagonist)